MGQGVAHTQQVASPLRATRDAGLAPTMHPNSVIRGAEQTGVGTTHRREARI
jgi:hypothetical protein